MVARNDLDGGLAVPYSSIMELIVFTVWDISPAIWLAISPAPVRDAIVTLESSFENPAAIHGSGEEWELREMQLPIGLDGHSRAAD